MPNEDKNFFELVNKEFVAFTDDSTSLSKVAQSHYASNSFCIIGYYAIDNTRSLNTIHSAPLELSHRMRADGDGIYGISFWKSNKPGTAFAIKIECDPDNFVVIRNVERYLQFITERNRHAGIWLTEIYRGYQSVLPNTPTYSPHNYTDGKVLFSAQATFCANENWHTLDMNEKMEFFNYAIKEAEGLDIDVVFYNSSGFQSSYVIWVEMADLRKYNTWANIIEKKLSGISKNSLELVAILTPSDAVRIESSGKD